MESTFEEVTKILLSRKPLPTLLAPPPANRSKSVTSTPWNSSLHDQICQLQTTSNVSLYAIASLHLFNDDIGSCHEIVEKHQGDDLADYLHYLLHRREGDYWNAKWWIRHLKSEEFKSIYLTDQYKSFTNEKHIEGLSSNNRLIEAQKRAQAFVDRCEEIEKTNNQQENEFLKQIQWEEMKRIFDFIQKK